MQRKSVTFKKTNCFNFSLILLSESYVGLLFNFSNQKWNRNGQTIVNYATLNVCIILLYPIPVLFLYKTYSTTIEHEFQ